MLDSNPKKFRVGICGGGIGGIVCALGLSRYGDIEVDVFEKAGSFSEIGAGIGIWPRAWQILKEFGLEDALLQTMLERLPDSEVPTYRYRKSDQSSGVDITTMYAKSGGIRLFYRPDFLNVLLQQLPSSCNLHVSKPLKSYSVSNSGSIEMLFEDGTTATCDVLVGADGIKSEVRRTLLTKEAQFFKDAGNMSKAAEIQSSIEPTWSGIVAYRTVINSETMAKKYPNHPIFAQATHYLGHDTHAIVYPIAQGRLLNFAAFHAQYDLKDTVFEGPWSSTVSKDELTKLFTDWEPEFQAFVECVKDPSKWAVHTVKPLHSMISSRDPVVLVGDAAHGMEPFQGNGAGQAIEDAYILAAVLGHSRTRKDNIVEMLPVYNEIRLPFSTEVAWRSHLAGKYFAMRSEDQNFDSSELQDLQKHVDTVKKHWEYVWDSTLKIDANLELIS